MSKTSDLRDSINQKLIAALENDQIPWRRPWASPRNSGRHRNFVSNRPYSGLNPWLLELHNIEHGFSSPLWGTFNQWKFQGCMVKKRPVHVPPGKWGCHVLLYRPYTKSVVNQQTGEEQEQRFFFTTTFTVFSAEQVQGEAVEKLLAIPEEKQPDGHLDFRAAEGLITATGVEISHDGDKACYRRPRPEGSWPNHRDGDTITVPPLERFFTLADYYSTLMHELAHFAEVRVGWDHRKEGYSAGELVAETASVYLCAELGLPPSDLENHRRYLRSWLDSMNGDHTFASQCATQASRVTDFLLSHVRKQDDGEGQSADDREQVDAISGETP